MTEPEEKKEETMEEYYSRVLDYDPDPEEVKKCYSKDFNEWLHNLKID